MKLACPCGATIHDAGDGLAHKAHVVPDQEWNALWDGIEEELARAGDAEAASMAIRRRVGRLFRLAWQCRTCGRLFLDVPGGAPREFVPASADTAQDALRARP